MLDHKDIEHFYPKYFLKILSTSLKMKLFSKLRRIVVFLVKHYGLGFGLHAEDCSYPCSRLRCMDCRMLLSCKKKTNADRFHYITSL